MNSILLENHPVMESVNKPELFNPHDGTSFRKLRARIQLSIADLKEATEVIVKNHYLHRGRTMGQIAYWILVDDIRAGVLLYAYPRLSVVFKGYHPMSMLELARMWLNPLVQGIRVVDSEGKEHAFAVATCAVGKSLRQIRRDWYGKYPHLPPVEAIVSWADEEHHEGTIYRAANFKLVGRSGGSLHGSRLRSNGGHDQLNLDYLHMKKAFLYEYSRPLSEREKEATKKTWAGLRPTRPVKRVLTNERAQMQRRLAFECNSMGFDVAKGNLGVVDGQPSVTEISQTL